MKTTTLHDQLGVLLGHLLKWRYQPEERCRSWTGTIREQRRRIQKHLADKPSLKSYLSEAIERGYQDGLDLMEQETPVNVKTCLKSVPFLMLKCLISRLRLRNRVRV